MFEIQERSRPSGQPSREIFRKGRPLALANGMTAELENAFCPVHGIVSHVMGYNQGGQDCVGFCLVCCREMLDDKEFVDSAQE